MNGAPFFWEVSGRSALVLSIHLDVQTLDET